MPSERTVFFLTTWDSFARGGSSSGGNGHERDRAEGGRQRGSIFEKNLCMRYSTIVIRYGNKVEFPARIIIKYVGMNGTIKTLVRDRKFGFITREGEVKDLFFHSQELAGVTYDELKEGDAVTFEVVETEKGPAAKNVSRAA